MKRKSRLYKITSFILIAALLLTQMTLLVHAEESDEDTNEATQLEETILQEDADNINEAEEADDINEPEEADDINEPEEADDINEPEEADDINEPEHTNDLGSDNIAEENDSEKSEDPADSEEELEQFDLKAPRMTSLIGFKLNTPAVQLVGTLSAKPGATIQVNGTQNGAPFTRDEYFADQSNTGVYGIDSGTTGNTFVINYLVTYSGAKGNGIGKLTGAFDVDASGNIVNLVVQDVRGNSVIATVSGTALQTIELTNPSDAASIEITTALTRYRITPTPSNADYILTDSRDGSILPPVWANSSSIQYALPVPNTVGDTNIVNYRVFQSGHVDATGNFAIKRNISGMGVGYFTTTFNAGGNEASYIYTPGSPSSAEITLMPIPTDFKIVFSVRALNNATVTMKWNSDGTVIPQSSNNEYIIPLVLADTLVDYTISANRFKTFTGQLKLKTDGSIEDLTTSAEKTKAISYDFDAPTQTLTIDMSSSVVLEYVSPGIYEADLTELPEYLFASSVQSSKYLMAGTKVNGGRVEIVNPETNYKMVIEGIRVEGYPRLGTVIRRCSSPITEYFTGIAWDDDGGNGYAYLNDIVNYANQKFPGKNFQSYYDCILYYMQSVGGYPGITSLDELDLEGLLKVFPSQNDGGGNVTVIGESEQKINDLAEKLLREYAMYFTLDYGMTDLPTTLNTSGKIDPVYDGLQYMDYVNMTAANQAQTSAVLNGIVIDEGDSYTFEDIGFSSIGAYLHNPFFDNYVNFDFKLYFNVRFVGIDGIVFHDDNQNGTYDNGEPVEAGTAVRLFRTSNLTTPIATTTTDSNGYYIFAEYNLMSNGDYMVQIDVPGGNIITSLGTTGTKDDNVFTLNTGGLTANSQTINYTTGTNRRANAGLVNRKPSTPGPNSTYTVTYNANGGTGSHADVGLASGSSYTVKGQGSTGITYAGYTFKGWNKTANGSGTSYAGGDKFTITGNVTLYAQWEKASDLDSTYTVTYNANGGTGSYADRNLALGSSYTVKRQTGTGITRNGYTFKEWNRAADGSDTSYAGGDKFTITGNVTLYAQWEKIAPAYTVNYDANGGTGSHMDTRLAFGSSYTVKKQGSTGITYDGYTFKGWNTAANGSGTFYAAGDQFVITGNVTLYAQWGKTSSGGGMSPGKFGRTRPMKTKTGDDSSIELWITLLSVSLTGTIYLLWTIRKRKQHR